MALRVADRGPVLGRLPVRAVALALGEEFEIAVEPLEARRAQRSGYLSLQGGFRMIAGPTRRFGDRQRDRIVTVPVAIAISGTHQRDTADGDYTRHQRALQPLSSHVLLLGISGTDNPHPAGS